MFEITTQDRAFQINTLLKASVLVESLHALFDASLSCFTLIQSSFEHLSLHCRIANQGDDGEEEDEDVVGGGGHVGQVDLEESLRHGLPQDVSRHAAVDTWKKINFDN